MPRDYNANGTKDKPLFAESPQHGLIRAESLKIPRDKLPPFNTIIISRIGESKSLAGPLGIF